jgi:hypothetical protein
VAKGSERLLTDDEVREAALASPPASPPETS